MIRNVVAVRVAPGTDPAVVEEAMARFAALDVPGATAYTIGADLGLRTGTWTFAIVADFVDVDAYRAYDLDEAHNAARANLAPIAEEIARVQFELA